MNPFGFSDLEWRVWKALGLGRENAKTCDEIERIAGIPRDRRNFASRKILKGMLLKGAPIVSGNAGSYRAASNRDIEENIESLRSRQRGIEQKIQAHKKFLHLGGIEG